MTPAERDRLVADINRHRLPSPEMVAWEANNLDTRAAACVTVGEHQWRHIGRYIWVCHRCNVMAPSLSTKHNSLTGRGG